MEGFHDIESLRHVITRVTANCEYHNLSTKPVVKFRGTVKLHGTNGGVRVTDGNVVAQGRNRVLTIQSDNFGFAHFVAGREQAFRDIVSAWSRGSRDVTIYGEWCGQGIQKKVAIASLPKQFVVFAIYDHTSEMWMDEELVMAGRDEDTSDNGLLGHLNRQNIRFVTQAQTFEITIDFNNPTPAAEELSRLTLLVEEHCPFSAQQGVEGMGEGIVWVMVEGFHERLTFKTKGEKHKKGDGPKNQVATDPEKVANISALVDLLLPEWRLEQGFSYLRENNIPVANTSTGEYLKWIAKDILKEEEDRIAANPYPWKEIQGTVMTRARTYFMDKLNEEAGIPGGV